MRMSSCVSAMPRASTYCLCIAPGFSTCDLSFESGLPEIAIVKEQPRLELDLAEPQRGIGERPARIDIEISCTRQRARFMPSAEVMPGRNEDQLAREIAQGRPGQAFNKGLTVVALPKLWNKEQMAGSPKTIFEWRVLRDLNRFRVEARQGRGIASDDLRRRNVDNRARFKIRNRMRGTVRKSSGLI